MAEIVSQYRIEVKEAVDNLGKLADATDNGAKKGDELGKKTEQAGQQANKASSNFAGLGKQILAAFGLVGVVTTFVSAIKNAVNITKNFEEQMSKVRAISGATTSEMAKLEKSAKNLGSTTKFTATQVGTLQEEFARLGFTTKEILAATQATLSLAAATGSTLADAAQVAGATVRGFGLDASETVRVADVMALSFSSSALSMGDFSEAMKMVAPIARAANIDIETTTALLGQLANAGLRGSLAGTALKNLLSKLSDENSELSKELGISVNNTDDLFAAFKKLQTANIDLTKATELTDERSKAAFITLINGIDSAEGLKAALDDAAGSALEMAKVMSDNLAGDVTKASSAWEGLMLAITKTDSARETVQAWTLALMGMTRAMRNAAGETNAMIAALDSMADFAEAGSSGASDFIDKFIKPLEDGESNAKATTKAMEQLVFQHGRLTANAKDRQAIQDEIERSEKRLDGMPFLAKQTSELKKNIEALKLKLIETDRDNGMIEAAIGVYERYLSVLDEAAKKQSQTADKTERSARSIATLSEELKTLKEQFENAEVGGKDFHAIASKIEAKALELARAIALVATDGIDADGDTEQQSAFNSLMNYKEKREKEQYDERKKQREEFDEWLKGKTEAELEALLQNNLMAVEITKERYAEEMQVASTVLTGIQQLYGSVTSAIIQGHNQELESLDRQLESGQISRERYDQQRRQLERERAKDQKASAIFSAILGTAIAVVNALQTQPFLPLGPIMAVLAGGLGAAQIAAVASQPLPQFAEGGWVDARGMIQGRAHAQGGVKLEAEGGEFIVNRAASEKNAALIEAINRGMGEAYIMRNWVAPAVDSALLNGWQDVGKSADLNGLTANLKDHNIIRAMDRNREATTYGFTLLANKLDSRKPKRGGYA